MARQTSVRGRTLAIIAVVLAAVTACGPLATTTSGSTPSLGLEEPELGVISQVTDPREIALPVDPYTQSMKDFARVERAVRQVVTQCMRRFGFSFDVPLNERNPAALKNGNGDKPNYSRLYGLLDESAAATYGYHPAESLSPEEYDDKLPEPGEEDSPDYLNVVMGYPDGGTYRGQEIPDGGCFGEARRTLAAGGQPFDPLINEAIMAEAAPAASADSRGSAAAASWSACMAEAGYDFRDPMEANDDDRWWRSEQPTEAETAVAVTDVRCKKTTNYVGIRMAVDSAYQLRVMAKRAQDLKAAREGHQRQLRNAAQILTDN